MACAGAPNFSPVLVCPETVMSSSHHSPEAIETAAAQWLARRDRGLAAAEQDAYLQWLMENPAHGAALNRLEKTWLALNQLKKWRPVHSPQPNPDLLAPSRRRYWRWSGVLAAAAMVAVALVLWSSRSSELVAPRLAIIHPGPERMTLEDGSIVELNAGAKVDVAFTPGERRVQLVRGEAHFTVAKNPHRPFIVSADKLSVRAVGTAFSVSLNRQAVSVLVTEGKVRLDEIAVAAEGAAPVPRELSSLIAGQQAVVAMTPAAALLVPEVREVTPSEIERALSWQGLRLEFVDMPLADVVAEFNRYNQRKLVVEDAPTGAMLVGGNFRADNVDTFVRLLDAGFGVEALTRGNEVVLRRVR
jgi:transmembrane sensor